MKTAQDDMDDSGDYDPEDEAGELPPVDEEEPESTEPMVTATEAGKAKGTTATIQEIRDLMIRTAYHTTDMETKRKLLHMLRVDAS